MTVVYDQVSLEFLTVWDSVLLLCKKRLSRLCDFCKMYGREKKGYRKTECDGDRVVMLRQSAFSSSPEIRNFSRLRVFWIAASKKKESWTKKKRGGLYGFSRNTNNRLLTRKKVRRDKMVPRVHSYSFPLGINEETFFVVSVASIYSQVQRKSSY